MNNLSQFKWMIIPMVCLGVITGSVILSSCKEKPIKEIEPIETLVPPTNETDDDDDTDKTIIHVGSAEGGNLVIDGTRLSINSNTIVEIASATYQTITIRNISGSEKSPVIIRNNGLVTVKNAMETNDIRHVKITGNNTPEIEYGFLFRNISYRAINMGGTMDFVTFSHISFENVNDYCISAFGENNSGRLVYVGTPESRTNNFKILNCKFDNTGSVMLGGELNEGTDRGLFKGVEIGYNIIKNSDHGALFVFTNVEDFDIHDNLVDHVNPTNNDHNGIFYMQGNGNFHHNILTNYQGNAIRLWAYSRGETPQTVEIHHNICYNTRKYGAFEIQTFDRNMIPGKTTYVNAKVYNNTVGKMNTSKDWDGQILDLYNMRGGHLEFFNNLGFDLYSEGGISDMINMGDDSITDKSNNVYKQNWQQAVVDIKSFVSKVANVGAK